MKNFTLCVFAFAAVIALCHSEPPVSKRPLLFHNWPPKSAQQLNGNRPAGGKQKTFVVQIRSDQPVPLVLKGGRGGPGQTHAHLHHGHGHAHSLHAPLHGHHLHLHHAGAHGVRGVGGVGVPRPVKYTGPVFLKTTPIYPKATAVRKPLKIKLTSSKPKSKPSFDYDKPFKYEKPHTVDYASLISDTHQLPLDTHTNFITDHFAPIHTIPAPNLALHDNHIHIQDTYLPPANSSPTPKPQPYHQQTSSSSTQNHNQYKVVEDNTNDLTIHDPLSGAQKLFAPDPDPSLPTSKIRPATESFNRPSNGQLPADVQNNLNTNTNNNNNNFVHPAQPIVQIVAEQSPQQIAAAYPEIYPIQFTPQSQLQPFVTANVPTAAVASIPLYNPTTFLVTQSNNLYSQHKQQLFRPVENVIETGYVNADLTQEVASNGQILQAAKDPHHNIHPVLDSAPQFAALIAAPALGEEHNFAPSAPEGGFVVSNYFGNAQDSSQLLQAYAEEEAHHQHLEELQHAQQQQEHHQLLLQQHQEQQEQLHQLQQQQYHHQQQQQQLHHQQQQQHQQLQQQPRHPDPAASAFEEHQRLVQQQLGANTPLRIFVPDEEFGPDGQRIQKRSDNVIKGIVEDADTDDQTINGDDMFDVSSSVEVSSEKELSRSK